jgi:hypothetical protein
MEMPVAMRQTPTFPLQRYAEEKASCSLRYPCYAQRSLDIRSYALTISKKISARVAFRTDAPFLLGQSRIGSGAKSKLIQNLVEHRA